MVNLPPDHRDEAGAGEPGTPDAAVHSVDPPTDKDFRLLADHLPTLCWMADGEGSIIWFNRQWHEYCGTTAEEMVGWGWQTVHHPEVLPSVIERWTASIRSGAPFEMTFPLRGADGVYRPFLTRVQPTRNADGRVVRWFGVNTEISAEKMREDQLGELMDSLPLLVSYIDSELRYQLVNRAYEEWFGTEKEDLIGKTIREVLGAEALALRLDRIRAVLRGEPQLFQAPAYKFDGQLRDTEVQYLPRQDSSGTITGFIALVKDVTERKAAEHALGERARHLSTLNQTGAAIAAELDVHRLVQLVTDAGVELTGARFGAFFYNVIDENGEGLLLYTLSGAERADFERFGHPRATDVFAPTFKGEGVVRSDDITADPRYGKNAPYRGMPEGHLPVRSYLAVPVVSRSSEVLGGLFFGHPEAGVFTDESEQLILGLAGQAAIAIDNARLFEASQRAQQSLEERVQERTGELEAAHEALRQSQKMEAIGQLTGGIAHDFNNLLTVIRGSADLLRRENLPEEKRRRYVEAICDTADRASKLTGQLLAFARRQALKPQLFDVGETIGGVAEMLRTVMGSRVSLYIDNECEGCLVETDLAQFETAIVNLAVNARDAMDGEGSMAIEIDTATSEDEREVVRVRVSDTGHGIAAEEVDRIFEPFYTTKEIGKGTGLGLSQVYGFVKQSNGDVIVETEVGEGTTFTLLLPKVEGDKMPDTIDEIEPAEEVGGGRVLVVEDNCQVGEFACHLLSDLGFEAILETTASEALRRLEADPSSFDLVFSDVVMPGMDGVEFARLIQKKWSDLPVILTSGYSHVLAEETQHGFTLLHKPYTAEALARTLKQARKQH